MEKLESNKIININCGLPLPPHIVQVIFSRLSISTLPTCRIVCKTWNRLILDYACSSKFSRIISIFYFDRNHIPFGLSSNPKIHCINIDTLSSVASFEFDADFSAIHIFNHCNGLLFIDKEDKNGCCRLGILNPMTNELFELPRPELENIHRF